MLINEYIPSLGYHQILPALLLACCARGPERSRRGRNGPAIPGHVQRNTRERNSLTQVHSQLSTVRIYTSQLHGCIVLSINERIDRSPRNDTAIQFVSAKNPPEKDVSRGLFTCMKSCWRPFRVLHHSMRPSWAPVLGHVEGSPRCLRHAINLTRGYDVRRCGVQPSFFVGPNVHLECADAGKARWVQTFELGQRWAGAVRNRPRRVRDVRWPII